MSSTFFIYARKSTEEEDRQIASIGAQIDELTTIAKNEGLHVAETFIETQSAKAPGRPVFNEMLQRIYKGEASGILCWKLDRLARNPVDGGQISWMLQQGTIQHIHTYGKKYSSTDNVIMMQVEFGMANQYVRDLSENVKRGVRHKVARGEWLGLAPFGYVNSPVTKNIEPHPTHSKVVALAFEEYATGAHSLRSLSLLLHELGVSSKVGKPLVRASIARLLSHQAYLGMGVHRGESYEGSFQPLVSAELFEKVQTVLNRKAKPRKTKKTLNFPFRGLMTCAECGSPITAQFARGKCGGLYRYYRCTKKRGPCSQSYVQEKYVAAQFMARIGPIAFYDGWKDKMLSVVREWERDDLKSMQARTRHLRQKIEDTQSKLDVLVSGYIEKEIPKESYLSKKKELLKRKLALVAELKLAKGGQINWLEPLKDWIEQGNKAMELVSSNSFEDMNRFVQKNGSNPVLLNKEVTVSFSEPWSLVPFYKAQPVTAAPARAENFSASNTSQRENLIWRRGWETPVVRPSL